MLSVHRDTKQQRKALSKRYRNSQDERELWSFVAFTQYIDLNDYEGDYQMGRIVKSPTTSGNESRKEGTKTKADKEQDRRTLVEDWTAIIVEPHRLSCELKHRLPEHRIRTIVPDRYYIASSLGLPTGRTKVKLRELFPLFRDNTLTMLLLLFGWFGLVDHGFSCPSLPPPNENSHEGKDQYPKRHS